MGERQDKLRQDRKQWVKKKGKSAGRNPTIDVDPKDERSVAQHMVIEMMEVYANKVGIPRLMGRRRWFTCVNLSRAIVGFHLQQTEIDKQGWSQSHKEWLYQCQRDRELVSQPPWVL